MAIPFVGLLALSLLGLWGCSRAPEELPGKPLDKTPKKSPEPSSGKSPPLAEQKPDLQHEILACQQAMAMIPRSSENCDISAKVRFAELTPDPSDNFAVRPKLLERMDSHYLRYFRLHTPQERLRHQDSLLMSSSNAVLFSGNFGPAWSEAEMDAWLEKLEGKIGKKINKVLSSKPLSKEELDHLEEPVEVLTKNLPGELKDLARQIAFPPHLSTQLNLKSPKITLWDFINQNLKVTYFTPRASDLPDPKLLGQMYSPFLQAVMLEVERWKELLGKDYLLGVLATLAHETYHVYYLRKLATRNPRLVGAVLLDERNGHLMSALVLEKFFSKFGPPTANTKEQKNAAVKLSGYYLDVYAANVALGFSPQDETFRTEFSQNLPKSLLSEHPEKQIDKYFQNRSIDLKTYLVEFFSRIRYQPREFPKEIKIHPRVKPR